MSAAGQNSTPDSLASLAAEARRRMPLPDPVRRLVAAGALAAADHPARLRWLEADPALCDLLLRWANSQLFNLGRPIATLEQAAALLGGREMARLATVAMIGRFFTPEVRIDGYSRCRLWRHSLAVAAVAALVARTCQKADPDEAFVAGALHDVGLLVNERLRPASFARLIGDIDALTETPGAERRLTGWDHQQLGAEVLEEWGLGGIWSVAARYHHQPGEVAAASHRPLVSCVSVANYLCSRTGWNSLGVHNAAPPPDAVFAALGIDACLLSVIWQQLPTTLEGVSQLR